MRKSTADPKVSEGGGQGGAPHAGEEIPLHTMLKTTVELISMWHPVEDAAAMESTCQSKLLEPRPTKGSPQVFQQELAVEQSFPEGLHLVEWSHVGEAHQGLSSRRNATLGGGECEDGVVA